jgi:hypothetical protein
MVIKRVWVWPAARMAGTLYATIGLIVGLLVAVASLVGAAFAPMAHDQTGLPPWFGALFGVGAIVILPIFYGIIGLVGGAISAGLYNLFAGLVGGIQIDLE